MGLTSIELFSFDFHMNILKKIFLTKVLCFYSTILCTRKSQYLFTVANQFASPWLSLNILNRHGHRIHCCPITLMREPWLGFGLNLLMTAQTRYLSVFHYLSCVYVCTHVLIFVVCVIFNNYFREWQIYIFWVILGVATSNLASLKLEMCVIN